jgi:hypothetical protein
MEEIQLKVMHGEHMAMPSERYIDRKQFFDSMFVSGVHQFVHPTGVIGIKLVIGVEEQNMDPYRSSPYGRSTMIGGMSIFMADSEETAKAEAFKGQPPLCYPPNSWQLEFKYNGNIFNIQKIPDEKFKAEFLMASGDYKHEFSQDLRHYLEEKGYTNTFDSIGWVSVQSQSQSMEKGGFVYNWISGVNSQFEFLSMNRLDNCSGSVD